MATAPAPWDSDPVVGGAQPAPAAPVSASPDAPWESDPTVSQPEATQAPQAQPAPDGSGFTDDQKTAIINYLPKAKDAADLERFSLEVSGGKSKIGNAQDIIDKLHNGATPDAFAWAQPTIDKSMGQQPKPGLRDAIGNAILGTLDNFMPGLGTFLKSHEESGRAFTANAADAVAGDFGPELGGLLDTATGGGDLSNNIAHERAILAGESDGHGLASAAGQLTGAGLSAPLGGEALDAAGIADSGSKLASAARATTGGAIYGAGSGGPDNRVAGAVTGAAIGGVTDVAAPYVKRAWNAITRATPETVAAAQSAFPQFGHITADNLEIHQSQDGSTASILVRDPNSGNIAGSAILKSADGKTVNVDSVIGAGGANSLGPAEIRQLMPLIRHVYPNAETITGSRVTGARSDAIAALEKQFAAGDITLDQLRAEKARLTQFSASIPQGVGQRTAAVSAVDAAKAAQDLGITLPKFALTDADRAKAAVLEQKPFGAPVRNAASEMVDTSKAARDQIANDLGAPADTDQGLGEQALDAAVKSNKARRGAIDELYTYARSASAGTQIAPSQTISTINSLLSDENSKIGGSKIAPVLQNIKDDLGQSGSISVQQARDLRTTLREQLTNEAGSTPSNADRITNIVMSAVNADMKNSLPADAYGIYKQADAAWAQQRSLEDDVLKPFLGRNFDNWGEDVAKRINSDVKGNGTRLARFLSSLPEDQANNVRATLIQHLGSATDGQQNAAGDSFSLNRFLTNWNNIKGARNLVFPQQTRDALNKLAQVAQVAKASEGLRNKSNTGRVVASLALGGLAEGGAVTSIALGDFKPLIIGALGSSLMAARQYGAAKLLASPKFAERLAKTPMNPKAAAAFWSRPWVRQLQLQNPSIAAEIQAFQSAFLSHVANDNVKGVSSVASVPNGQQSGQNQENQ